MVVPPPPPPPPPLLPPPLPQPMPKPAIPANTKITRMLRHLRRRAGIPKKSRPAIATPPPAAKNLFSGLCAAPVVDAVVVTVSVVVAAVVPLTVAAGAEQAGESLALAGAVVTAQVKLTAPVKPLAGVTVMVLVFPVVAPAASDRLVGPGVSENPGGVALTVMLTVAVAVIAPEVAVMFAV